MAAPRLSYEQSCDRLRVAEWFDAADRLPLPSAMPRFDDAPPFGVRFFRTGIAGADRAVFRNLTLPRTYVGRSHVGPVSFANTDLSESCLCWNDFEDVDFTNADLTGADLRASNFVRVRFVRAHLVGADLRHARFVDCDFGGADVSGSKWSFDRADLGPRLMPAQRAAAAGWWANGGPLPDGG